MTKINMKDREIDYFQTRVQLRLAKLDTKEKVQKLCDTCIGKRGLLTNVY